MLEGDVSRETSARLEIYRALLEKWSPRINLVAPGTLKQAEQRHFADSLQVLALAPQEAKTWIDLGSGGGFPGLVVAIAAADRPTPLDVTLVEADQRKAAFLRSVLRETGTRATVLAQRIEDVPETAFDVVSARALASLDKLLPLASRFCGSDTLCLFPKGARHQEELEAARKDWQFGAQIHPSRTDPSGAILSLKDIRHA